MPCTMTEKATTPKAATSISSRIGTPGGNDKASGQILTDGTHWI